MTKEEWFATADSDGRLDSTLAPKSLIRELLATREIRINVFHPRYYWKNTNNE